MNSMKKTNISLLAATLLLCASSCTKEELNIVDSPAAINENSTIFQSYLAERAISFIKMYRFDKLGDILEKITDPTIKSDVDLLHRQYRTKAEKEALFYINSDNDSLYFLVPSENESDPATRLHLQINNENVNIPKSRGLLSGLSKFPKLRHFSNWYALSDEIQGIGTLADLESFYWMQNEAFSSQYFPNQQYVATPLKVDFSDNEKLKSITLVDIDLQNIVFPQHQLELFETKDNSIYNSSDNLNKLNAKRVVLAGKSAQSTFIINNNTIQSLALKGRSLKSIDISKTKLESLDLEESIETATWNTSVKNLTLRGARLSAPLRFPESLETMILGNYTFEDWDFSYLSQLREIEVYLSGVDFQVDIKKVKFPLSLQKLVYSNNTKNGVFDLRYLSNLVEFDGINDHFKQITFPKSLRRLKLYYPSEVLDLGTLTKLDRINIYADSKLKEIILPTTLSEQDYKNNYSSLNISRSTKLSNAPSWLTNYVSYVD